MAGIRTHQALTQANETVKTSTEISAVERAWVTANAAVATRNNIATRIAAIEKSGLSAGCLDFYHNQVKINLRKLTLNRFVCQIPPDQFQVYSLTRFDFIRRLKR